jgi:hypothetical protein
MILLPDWCSAQSDAEITLRGHSSDLGLRRFTSVTDRLVYVLATHGYSYFGHDIGDRKFSQMAAFNNLV